MRLRDKFGNICNVRTEKALMRCDWEWWGLRIVINGEGCLIANLDANVEFFAQRWLDGKHDPSHYLKSERFQYLAK